MKTPPNSEFRIPNSRTFPRLVLAVTVALFAAPALAAPAVTAMTHNLRGDAALRDVCFVDAAHGWAVGEHGAIWHTADGGENWQLQTSGVACRLSSVAFLDARRGWAAGGWTEPYTHASQGVVLRTDDGGQTWKAESKLLLPALAQIEFFDGAKGIGVGQASAMFPAGVFLTSDGGRSWSPLSLDANSSAANRGAWLAGDFLSTDAGVLAGRLGTVAQVARRSVTNVDQVGAGVRNVRAVRMIDARNGWLAGDGGLLLRTSDGGASWQSPAEALPAGAEQIDFSAIEAVGDNIWVAGTPGTRVLRSADGGRSFAWQRTGQTLPLDDITFVDAQMGYAVGSLGTVLHTDDGGRTWRRQRGGGSRAAWLALVDSARSLPPELAAHLSCGEGYLGVVHEIVREDLAAPDAADANQTQRLEEAMIAAGSGEQSAAWQFPVRERRLRIGTRQIIDAWDRAADGNGIERLEEHLVKQLRTWRPDVVFTHPASPRGDDPLGHVLNQVVLRAVESAGDATRFSEQLTELGLQPWKVRKVYSILDAGARGTTSINGGQWSPRLGGTLAEFVLPVRGLLESHFQRPPEEHGFSLILDRLPPSSQGREFFSGIPLPPGSEARRAEGRLPAAAANVLQQMARERRQVQAIVDAADDDARGGVAWLGQISRLTQNMTPAAAGWMLNQLANRYHEQGDNDLAAETFQLLATRYPEHVASGGALAWLVQYYASGEQAQLARRKGRLAVPRPNVRTVAAEEPLDGALPGNVLPPEQLPPSASEAHNGEFSYAARTWADRLERSRPALAADPDIAFPAAVARKQTGGAAEADRFYRSFVRSAAGDNAWRQCAEAELWLAAREGVCAKPIWICRHADQRPRLDGKLDEPVWRDQRPVAFKSPLGDDIEFPAVALAAYDDEYLYLAVQCRRAVALERVPDRVPRRRDEDLANRDRVQLLIDIDRDYTTFYQFEFDDRGHTRDSLGHSTGWNPKWFVANEGDTETWTCELAIPLKELAPSKPTRTTAWAVGLQRIVPGAGFQGWQQPAAAKIVPEGFGLMLFE